MIVALQFFCVDDPKLKKTNTHSHDYYAQLAKQEGYPARSVYKLKEIQERFHIIRPDDVILDIGAYPGSFSLYLLSILGRNGRIIGVDTESLILPQKHRWAYQFIQGDIFDQDITRQIIESGPYSVIISDAAPFTTGNRLVDTAKSLEIAEQVVDICRRALKSGGNIIVKVFQGGDEGIIMQRLKHLCQRVRGFKPKASRKESKEIFYIGFSAYDLHRED